MGSFPASTMRERLICRLYTEGEVSVGMAGTGLRDKEGLGLLSATPNS